MADLSSQLSAFKNKIRSGPSVTMPRQALNKPTTGNSGAPLSYPNSQNTSNVNSPKRPNHDSINETIKKQKVNRQRVSNSHLSTQLHLAVERIKQNDQPLKVTELQEYLSFDITQTLLPLLKEIDRIKYDPNTNSLEYVSLHNIRSSSDLLNFLRSQPTFKGVSVKDLKDGWANYLTSINELEAENKILVLRTKKENAPRLVWANFGGNLNMIDEEFQKMWSTIKVPNQDDLYSSLIDQGLKPTGADPNIIKRKPKKEEKKQKKARRGKITNTHMKGILKDYSQLM